MRMFMYYGRKKKLIVILIGSVIFVIGSLITVYFNQNTMFIPLIFSLYCIIILFCMFFPYLHRVGFFCKTKFNYESYKNSNKKFPPRL